MVTPSMGGSLFHPSVHVLFGCGQNGRYFFLNLIVVMEFDLKITSFWKPQLNPCRQDGLPQQSRLKKTGSAWAKGGASWWMECRRTQKNA